MRLKQTIVLSRRQVLRGAGGFTLGLPFLPSLVPVPAYAANVVAPSVKRFVAINWHHGAIRETSMFPDPSAATQAVELATGHTAHFAPLQRRTDGADAVVSQVLRAPATDLTDRIVGKMNVLWGLDYAYGGGHNAGAALGNYDATDGDENQMAPRATIDQVMGWSSSFYGNLDGVKLRVMVGPADADSAYHGGSSFVWSNPSTKSGTIQRANNVGDPAELFKTLFGAGTSSMPPAMQRKPIVDRVIEDFRRLRNGNKRMSSDDKQRLDDHMDRMAELQRTLGTGSVTPSASCQDVTAPAATKPTYDMFVDVFVAAFLCGASRVAVIAPDEEAYVDHPGSWHQDTAHKWDTDPAAQARLVTAGNAIFRHLFLPLARKLDVDEGGGQTLLDNSLVQMVNECGAETHGPVSIPVITAGAAGGFLKTGLFCDYRNRNLPTMWTGKPGLNYNRWLGTALQAVGVPRSEYEQNGALGYGDQRVVGDLAKVYLPAVSAQQGDVLPFLKA